MSPSTVIIGLILLAIIIITVISYMKKMKSGCCGGGDAVSVTPPADNNPAHYSYHAVLTVEGMSCPTAPRALKARSTRAPTR